MEKKWMNKNITNNPIDKKTCSTYTLNQIEEDNFRYARARSFHTYSCEWSVKLSRVNKYLFEFMILHPSNTIYINIDNELVQTVSVYQNLST